LLGQQWSIPVADIPIPFSIAEETWTFEPQTVYVPLPDLFVEQEVIDFGTVIVGEESFRYYDLRNDGEARAVMDIALSDDDAFTLWDEALSIEPVSTGLASLRFTPKTPGLHEAEVQVHSNDPDAPLSTVKVWGMALPAQIYEPPGDGQRVSADSGCGCRVVASPRATPWWPLLVLGLAVVTRRRRHRDERRWI
jgi:MYXO-CTERM domain-containing protein